MSNSQDERTAPTVWDPPADARLFHHQTPQLSSRCYRMGLQLVPGASRGQLPSHSPAKQGWPAKLTFHRPRRDKSAETAGSTFGWATGDLFRGFRVGRSASSLVSLHMFFCCFLVGALRIRWSSSCVRWNTTHSFLSGGICLPLAVGMIR